MLRKGISRGIMIAGVIVVIVVVLGGVAYNDSQTKVQTSLHVTSGPSTVDTTCAAGIDNQCFTSSTSNACSNEQTSYLGSRTPLNYTELNVLLSAYNLTSSCLNEAQNTIFIFYGYNWCLVSYFMLPNGTLVTYYRGSDSTSVACT